MGIGRESRDDRRIDSAWAVSEPPPGEADQRLTRERIVARAVALLDAEGTAEKLTMRRLGAELGVTSAALYWHVRTRGDLLDRALDAIFSEVEIPASDIDWRLAAESLLLGWRRTMLAHPWSPPLAGRPLLGPQVMLRIEALQAALVRGGLAGFDLAAATRMLADLVVGSALTEAAARQADGAALRRVAHERISEAPERFPTLAISGHLDQVQPDDEMVFVAIVRQMLRSGAMSSPQKAR